ncbi:MAG: nucleoside triphosphate pyrophosphohydrolase [SAR324 cluster bacterium]|nr:nucleoside triphosphate pyrophosphohydrolase [SAR324 cluster bacterium]
MPADAPSSDALLRLLEVMAALRGEAGCPWDRQQTHRTLTPYLIEEAYELIEAIEEGADGALCEELGDVLLQVVFHARIAEERGAFSFQDVAAGIAEKMVTRHPHVFGGDPLDTPEQVREQWHEHKMKERSSALQGVPAAQPALHWARQISIRAAQTGFDWEHVGEILDKSEEELREIREVLANGGARRESLEVELGDLLLALVNLARQLKIDPDSALRRATRKFIARFQRMEKALHANGARAGDQQPEQWRRLWEAAKEAGNSETP